MCLSSALAERKRTGTLSLFKGRPLPRRNVSRTALIPWLLSVVTGSLLPSTMVSARAARDRRARWMSLFSAAQITAWWPIFPWPMGWSAAGVTGRCRTKNWGARRPLPIGMSTYFCVGAVIWWRWAAPNIEKLSLLGRSGAGHLAGADGDGGSPRYRARLVHGRAGDAG